MSSPKPIRVLIVDDHPDTLEWMNLLLENRGCELLWCRPLLSAAGPLDRMRGRHSTLKCALDLAGATCLLGGEYPDGAPSRVAMARQRRVPAPDPASKAAAEDQDRLWGTALAWRRGEVEALPPEKADDEWRATVRSWTSLWHEAGARLAAGAPEEPVARALALARRARLRRRVREVFAPRGENAPRPGLRLWPSLGGTLQHRVHASAALLLHASGLGGASPLSPRTAAALARLGVVPDRACAAWAPAATAVVAAWDGWLLDGQRTARVS